GVAQEGGDRLVQHRARAEVERHEAEARLAKPLEETRELQSRLQYAAFARIAEPLCDCHGARHAEAPGRAAPSRVRARRRPLAQQVRPVAAPAEHDLPLARWIAAAA